MDSLPLLPPDSPVEPRSHCQDVPDPFAVNAPSCCGAGLTAAERQWYRTLLRAVPDFDGSPDRAWLQAEAGRCGVDLDATLAKLEGQDLIVRDPSTGAIVAVYPFSLRPTSHRVELDDGRAVYAMCAVDALGIPLMLGCEAAIHAVDPMGGEAVRVVVRPDGARWEPPEAVVVVASRGGPGPAAEVCCGFINFFPSTGAARAYLDAHPGIRGRVLTQAEALEVARRCFESLLDGGDGIAVDEDSRKG
ncbi:MAG TPA: alkylmercury lyase family protein [Chloroflexota bacterium]